MSRLRVMGIVGGALAFFVANAAIAQCTELSSVWAGTTGTTQDEMGESASVSGQGEIVISGRYDNSTDHLDLDPTSGVDLFDTMGAGFYVIKLTNGFGYSWGKTIFPNVEAFTAIDSSDRILIAGGFSTTVDFDPGENIDNRQAIGAPDVFVSKWDPDGSYMWTRSFGGKGSDDASDLAIDDSGNVFVTGWFEETADFNPDGLDIHESNGGHDFYVTKLLSDGSYGWTYSTGGVGYDSSLAVATGDGGSKVCIAGSYRVAADFDPGPTADVHVSQGGDDIFLSTISSDGTYQWTRTFGGTGNDHATDVAIDADGNILVVGSFESSVDFDPGQGEDVNESNGARDIFLVKLSSEGTLLWAHTIGGEFWDYSERVVIDDQNSVYLTGCFGSGAPAGYSIDFDPSEGSDLHATNGGCDIFVTKIRADGTYGWTATLGHTQDERGVGISIDDEYDLIITGWFGNGSGPPGYTVDFDPGIGVDNHQTMGDMDMFVVKLQQPDLDGPSVIHATGAIGETRPFSGFIDPRAESLTGEAPDLGIDEVTFVFDGPVRAVGGGEVGVDSFVVTTTGGTPPIINSVDASQNPMISVTFSTPPPLKEWTTVTAIVEDECGNLIATNGDMGPGALEPDRIDFLFLPGDADASRLVTPFDMLRFRQIANKVVTPKKGEIEDFVDTNRTGVYTAFDFLAFRQLLNGVAPATQSWMGETPNHSQP